jgi:signal transduction histidine kinase
MNTPDDPADFDALRASIADLQVRIDALPAAERARLAPDLARLASAGTEPRPVLDGDLLDALLRNTGDEVWFSDLQGNVSLLNDLALRNLGLATPADLHRPFAELVSGMFEMYDLNGAPWTLGETALREALRGQVSQDTLTARNVKTGELRYRRFTAAPVYGKDQRILGALALVSDVTEQRRLQVQQVEYLSQAEVPRRLLEYREKERQAIALSLHDSPIQDLSCLVFRARLAREKTPDPILKEDLDDISRGIQDAIEYLRNLINDLRPPALIRFGLAKAARCCLDDFAASHPNIHIEASLADDAPPLPEQASISLFRILQEALHNAAVHASASKIAVRLRHHDHHLVLEVQDDGAGFTLAANPMDYPERGAYGLADMQERAQAIGGALEIDTRPNSGTLVRVTLPR